MWAILWDRYVDSQTDYRASVETLARKLMEAGEDARRLLDWLASAPDAKWAQGKQAKLWDRVFSEQFELSAEKPEVQPKAKEQLDSDRVQNPHDPEATYASKGNGEQRKEHVGYRGLPRSRLQNYFIGAACNVKRWLRRVAWQMQQETTATAGPATG